MILKTITYITRKNNDHLSKFLFVFLLFFAFCFFSIFHRSIVCATTPQKINYQGYLRINNEPATQTINLTFSIWDNSVGGSQLWTCGPETISPSLGRFNYVLGNTCAFSGIDWASGSKYLQINVAGTDLTPREEIITSPYSFRSDNTDTLDGFDSPYFATATHIHPATDATTLDAYDSTYFATATHTHAELEVATNATTLDGFDSSYFATATHIHPATDSASVDGINASSTAVANYLYPLNSDGAFQISTSAATSVYAINTGSGNAIEGYTTGTGRAGYFQISNTGNVNPAVRADTTGAGKAGYFSINNTGNTNPAVYGETVGSGAAVDGYTTGAGRAGYFHIANTGNASEPVYLTTNGTGALLAGNHTGASGNLLQLQANGADKVVVDHNGNVGIGTTSPNGKFEVVSNEVGIRIYRDEDNYYAPWIYSIKQRGSVASPQSVQDNDYLFGLYGWGYQNGAYRIAAVIHGMVDGPPSGVVVPAKLVFNEGAMVLKDNGNLGIGTATPTTRLHVVSDANGANAFIEAYGDGGLGVRPPSDSGGHLLYTTNAANSAYRFVVDNSGNISTTGDSYIFGSVGIGTATPTETLDINSNTIRVRTSKTPVSASDICDAGEIAWDSSYVYVCIATNTWKRSALSTW